MGLIGGGCGSLSQIPKNCRKDADLSKRIALGKKYDLCISVEVGEHLPREKAEVFLDNLCRSSDVILFSAAVPGQGGTDHINEQWPDYWRKKFQKRGYACYDAFRGRLWEDGRVEWWYRQNLFLYVKENVNGIFTPKPAQA